MGASSTQLLTIHLTLDSFNYVLSLQGLDGVFNASHQQTTSTTTSSQ